MQIFPAAASPILQRNDVRATSTRDIPVRTDAQRDVNAPAVLLRNYAKRKRTRNCARQSDDDGGLSRDMMATESNARTPIRKLFPKICPDWVCVLVAFSNRLG
jgi:hypothetical protein